MLGATAINDIYSINFTRYDDGLILMNVTEHDGSTLNVPIVSLERAELLGLLDAVNRMLYATAAD